MAVEELPSEPTGITVERIQLLGFSEPDAARLRLFFERPTASGQRVQIVQADADLLVINGLTSEGALALADPALSQPRIGIVEHCSADAAFYQVPRDGQLLFALAQGLNRIREGWTPPMGWRVQSAARPVEPPPSRPAAELASEPAASPQPVTSEKSPPASQVAATAISLHFLVVDDSLFSREAVADVLRRCGHVATTAESGSRAVELARQHRFDVALVDFEMPVLNGPATLRRLRKLGTACPRLLIMLTGRDGKIDRLRCQFAGADAYLVKPARMSELNAVIAEHQQRLTQP